MRGEVAVRWWFKARRGHVLLPLALVVFAAALFAVQDVTVILPALAGNTQIALSVFVPVPLLALLMAVLESRLSAAEASAVRSVNRLDNVLITAVLAAGVLCGFLVSAVQGTATAACAGRNAAFLAGLMLLGRAWAGQAAVMIPVGWLFFVSLTGFHANVPHTWTIVALPADNPFAATVSLVALAVGLAAQIRTSRKTA
jgi:hypothetical protein